MFCPKCGADNADFSKFCTNCGSPLGVPEHGADQSQPINPTGFDATSGTGFDPSGTGFDPSGNPQGFNPQNGANGFEYQQSNPYYGSAGISGRSIALAIVLSLVTCGIYGIYWFIVLTDETNQLSGRANETSGILAFLLSIVTCGFYGWFWAYKMGEKVDLIKNDPNGGSAIIFIILQIFGLGIVNYAIAQDAINKAVNFQ